MQKLNICWIYLTLLILFIEHLGFRNIEHWTYWTLDILDISYFGHRTYWIFIIFGIQIIGRIKYGVEIVIGIRIIRAWYCKDFVQ